MNYRTYVLFHQMIWFIFVFLNLRLLATISPDLALKAMPVKSWKSSPFWMQVTSSTMVSSPSPITIISAFEVAKENSAKAVTCSPPKTIIL